MTRTYLGPTIPLSGPDAVPIAGQPAPRYEGPDRLTPAPPSGRLTDAPAFPQAAPHELTNPVQRGNLHHAMTTIRTKRTRVTAELDHWEELRLAGEAIKNRTLRNLDTHLLRLEESLSAAGTVVHWARDAAEANRIVTDLVKEALADEDVDYDGTGEVMAEVVKVKSMVTQEIGLNEALEAERVAAWETDLAEIIVQLGHDHPSHFLVPAIHRNRAEVREIFLDEMGNYGRPAPADLDAEPRNLAAAARLHLREKFLRAKVGISGANFAVAETGTLAVVESEGNGRMCLTLPQTLISIVGIEKVLPTFDDLEVFLQLLPRSSTAERMNPYTSLWTGPDPDGVDGPQKMHVVLLDNGRTRVLAEPQGRDALRCIRCSASLNVCPVYEKVGGHAYGSFYPGPIGSILTPQLRGTGSAIDKSLPFASSLCGACFDVCPVRIPIPDLLVHMRTKVVEDKKAEAAQKVEDRRGLPFLAHGEPATMTAAAKVMGDPRLWRAAVASAGAGGKVLGALGVDTIGPLPGPLAGWTDSRDVPAPPKQSFRAWWRKEHAKELREQEARGDTRGAEHTAKDANDEGTKKGEDR